MIGILVKTCLLCLQELLHSVPWLLSLLLLVVAHLLSQIDYEEWSSLLFFVKLFMWNKAAFGHLNAHFLLQLHHFLSSALLLIKDKITCNDIKQVCTLTKLFLCLGGHSYLFALESGVHQFRLHTHRQASCVPASFAVGPSDAVHLEQGLKQMWTPVTTMQHSPGKDHPRGHRHNFWWCPFGRMPGKNNSRPPHNAAGQKH